MRHSFQAYIARTQLFAAVLFLALGCSDATPDEALDADSEAQQELDVSLGDAKALREEEEAPDSKPIVKIDDRQPAPQVEQNRQSLEIPRGSQVAGPAKSRNSVVQDRPGSSADQDEQGHVPPVIDTQPEPIALLDEKPADEVQPEPQLPSNSLHDQSPVAEAMPEAESNEERQESSVSESLADVIGQAADEQADASGSESQPEAIADSNNQQKDTTSPTSQSEQVAESNTNHNQFPQSEPNPPSNSQAQPEEASNSEAHANQESQSEDPAEFDDPDLNLVIEVIAELIPAESKPAESNENIAHDELPAKHDQDFDEVWTDQSDEWNSEENHLDDHDYYADDNYHDDYYAGDYVDNSNYEFAPSPSPEDEQFVVAPLRDWIEMDDEQAVFEGNWVRSRAVNSFTGVGYHHSNFDGRQKKARFSLHDRIEVSGYYHVFGYWTPHSNRATNARFSISSLDSSQKNLQRVTRHVNVNQRVSRREGNYLGTYYFTANLGKSTNSQESELQEVLIHVLPTADGYVIADGIALQWVGSNDHSYLAQRSPIHIDNNDFHYVRTKGDWDESRSIAGFDGDSYLHDRAGLSLHGKPEDKEIRYAPHFAEAGHYQVFVKWPSYPNRAVFEARIMAYDSQNTNRRVNHHVTLDQRSDVGKDSEGWYQLRFTSPNGRDTQDTFYFREGQDFNSGAIMYSRRGNTQGFIIADSVKFVKVRP